MKIYNLYIDEIYETSTTDKEAAAKCVESNWFEVVEEDVNVFRWLKVWLGDLKRIFL
jgi:hypothetical protein